MTNYVFLVFSCVTDRSRRYQCTGRAMACSVLHVRVYADAFVLMIHNAQHTGGVEL
jgi:hypothetical protein